MDLNYECCPTFHFKTTDRVFRPTLLRKNCINFNFYFKLKTFNWCSNLDPMLPPGFIGQQHVPVIVDISAHMSTAKTSPSYEDIREVIERVLASLPYNLPDNEREELIKLAWKEAFEAVRTKPLCYKVMNLDFEVLVQHNHVYDRFMHEISHRCCMVPAADSSIQSLKKCEINSTESCCICLEDFSGEGCEAMELPCEHVFHGDCIKEWLGTSHYCPLCRFEMPTS